MRAAQKARWARIKGTAPSEEAAPKKKRKMSAEGLANIRAGVAKRMAAQGKAVQKPKKKKEDVCCLESGFGACLGGKAGKD
jgi:hypothetical protein